MFIISVVGHPASGKDTAADYLAERGFVKISSSDYLRSEMKKIGMETHRANMTAFVSEMRAKFGNGYLAEEIIQEIKEDTVISGFRNTAEVKVLQDAFGKNFTVIAVDAPLATRYAWAKERGRIGDDISFARFVEEEKHERTSESGSHNLDEVIAMADITIVNDGTKEDLFRKVDEIVAKLGK